MSADNAPADSEILWVSGSGDTGRGGVERRSLLQVTFTHHKTREMDYSLVWSPSRV